MKIFYAANNSLSSKIQLYRFLQYNQYDIKIASYSNIFGSIFNLESLLNFKKDNIISYNNNYILLYNLIKRYNPDLILSDLDPYSSNIGFELKIPVWQVSSMILNFGLTKNIKKLIKVYKKYGLLLSHNYNVNYNTIFNSDKKLIVSHFGDTKISNKILNDFEWVRPYFEIGKESKNCEHNVVGVSNDNNKLFLNNLKGYNDVVVFSNLPYESYGNIKLKDINNEAEYYCNLKNCHYFINNGEPNYLADGFYNQKSTIIFPDLHDITCILNSYLSDYLSLTSFDLNNPRSSSQVRYNTSVKFLHEHIDEFAKMI